MRLRIMGELFLLVLACAFPVFGQDRTIEYGQPEELRGVTKVFVDTRTYVRQREMIGKALSRRLPNLQVVSRPEEAAIHLRYSLKGLQNGQCEGMGTVVKLVGGDGERVLLSVQDDIPPILETVSVSRY